jgi:hypothetical protein
MIPAFNHSHVLPPFLGGDPTASAAVSPYAVSSVGLVERFGHTVERRRLLAGLFAYRTALASHGFVRGFQWIDGSFVEDVEHASGRAPDDIDLVTFAHSPSGLSSGEISTLLNTNPDLFDAKQLKARFGCEGFLVPLDKSPERLVRRSSYYFNLFSHRRSDYVWKGMLHLPLDSDDTEAQIMLDNMTQGDPYVAAT